MNSGITRGGLARNSQIQEVPELLEKKQKKGRKIQNFGFFFSFPPPSSSGFEIPREKEEQRKKKKKSWNFCGFKTEFSGLRNFWDWGVLGFFGFVFTAVALQKKKNLKKERKIEKNKE